MSTSPSAGFLTLDDLREIHNTDPLFDSSDNDVDEQFDEQQRSNPGVGFDLRLGDQFYLSGESYTCSSQTEQGIHIQPA